MNLLGENMGKKFIFNLGYCSWIFNLFKGKPKRVDARLYTIKLLQEISRVKWEKYCTWKLHAAILKRPTSSHHSSKINFIKGNLLRINTPPEVFHVKLNSSLAVFVDWLDWLREIIWWQIASAQQKNENFTTTMISNNFVS